MANKQWIVAVHEAKTGALVHSIYTDSERKAEKVERGLLQKIDTSVFYTKIESTAEPTP